MLQGDLFQLSYEGQTFAKEVPDVPALWSNGSVEEKGEIVGSFETFLALILGEGWCKSRSEIALTARTLGDARGMWKQGESDLTMWAAGQEMADMDRTSNDVKKSPGKAVVGMSIRSQTQWAVAQLRSQAPLEKTAHSGGRIGRPKVASKRKESRGLQLRECASREWYETTSAS